MSTEILNPSIIRKLGLEALTKALGPIGMVRFLQQFETGAGDYTEDRRTWLENTDVQTIVEKIKSKRKIK